MKTYELIIDESKESGVDYIALVDRPAIESDWVAFNEAKQNFKIQDEEKRIVSGYFMIADKPIYRNSPQFGEHNVVFSAETIKDIQRKFMTNNINTNTNLMHEDDLKMDDVVIFEHIVLDSERGARPHEGFDIEADGSWFGSMYIPPHKEKLWNAIKEGQFKGFSVEGFFNYKDPNESAEETMRKVKEVYSSDIEPERKLEILKGLLVNI